MESGWNSREVMLQTGQSNVEVPLPLTNSSIWTRLRYSLAPDLTEARAFASISGIVALSRIADHVFELKLSNAGVPHRGSRLSVYAEAVHPVTRTPISGIEWKSKLLIDEEKKEVTPALINKIGEFAEFVFNIPEKEDAYRQATANVEVSGRLGDFEQKTTIRVPLFSRFSGRFQSDKPIYQPGQTMHLRAVILDFQGRAAQGAKIKLNVENQDHECAHTAHLVSSNFGIIQDEWTIPETASLGAYNITLALEDGDDFEITRHIVRVSRYELPVFTVTAKPDRTAYLPAEQPRVTIAADYLFGKPVPGGQVRIVRTGEREWNSKKRKYEITDETVAEGRAGDDGKFVAQLDLKSDHNDLQKAYQERFRDIHFASYYKDVTSGRTEQRRFDIRITLQPIHIYVIRSGEGGLLPAALYVSASYADGRPASAEVEILFPDKIIRLHTNKYGVGKTLFQNKDYGAEKIKIRAVDSAGISGILEPNDWWRGVAFFRLETSHTIHRAGEPVKLQITSPPDSPVDQLVMICAISGDKEIARQVVRLTNHKGEAIFRYQPDFKRTISFVAWNAIDSGFRYWDLGSKTVIFPDYSDLNISAATDRKIYKPGEEAFLRMQVASADGKPVEAAIGLAVVDQAVLERARTDDEFGHRSWFTCAFCGDPGEEGIGGVRLNDLYALNPAAAISPELDLVAETLSIRHSGFINSENGECTTLPPDFAIITSQMRQMEAALNNNYLGTLEIPKDASALRRIPALQWSKMRDPWGMPYSPKFSVEYGYNVLTLWSAGPDKTFETEDDFSVHDFRRPYFLPTRNLINEALSNQNYPATDFEFLNILRSNGLLLESLRDPWGSPYRANVKTEGKFRRIRIISAGPDRQFQTQDDFSVADFSGSYFQVEGSQIKAVLQNAAAAPQTIDEFLKILKSAGLDVSHYHDAWDRPYLVLDALSSRYDDRTKYTTVQEFGGPAVLRKDIVPVTKHFITFSLHSLGPDGIENTGDDFDIASFSVLTKEEATQPEQPPAKSQTAVMLQGTGLITGVTIDPTGSIVPNVAVTLVDAAGILFETVTNQNGTYYFKSVPAGIYSLTVVLPGFYKYEVSKIPVAEGKTTSVDIELQLAARQDAVEGLAESDSLILESASSVGRTVSYATPRVREYFPETLFWVPEMITDANGLARTQIPAADSVTTWKIAVAASTADGRFAEAESEFRTFQPFFLDFNPPLVLTEGDQIELPVAVRNYRDRAQKVNVSLVQNEWATVQGNVTRQVTVPANSSVNATYVVQAKNAKEKAVQRITADSGSDRDAIEKSLRIHPDGQEITHTSGDLVSGPASFNITIPQNAIKGATRGEIRIYPNIASLLLESASAILAAPHGCAEQTISAGYANLIALRFVRAAGIQDAKIEERALKNIRLALDTLGRFQDSNGGVRYWNTGDPDIAVTSYALGFLIEASAVVPVDEEDLSELVSWLEKQQATDGRWKPRNTNSGSSDRQVLLLTSTVLRSLAAAHKARIKVEPTALSGAYHHIAQLTDSLDEPYMLASFILAALDSGDEALLGNAVKRLAALEREERGGLYWDLQTNSPFYGWGTAGRYETTGLAVSALCAWRAAHSDAKELDSQIRRGLVFLLRGRDPSGSWSSTQSTIRAMRALVDASTVLGSFGGRGRTIEIRSNEHTVKTINMPDAPKATDPLIVDLSSFLSSGDNQISLMPSSGIEPALMLISSTHWLPWEQTKPRTSPELRLNVQFDRLEARAGEPVRCSVKAERVGFRGYGMMLAEIGLPPGTEVDRASLEKVIEDGSLGVNRYEILPDHVVFYLWPSAGGSFFEFYITARMPMNAKSAPSILYDYYNPEALSELAPFHWTVK